MPELPEVETVRRGLAPAMEGKRLTRVALNRADLRFPFADNFVQVLTGATIVSMGRRAKYLVARLDREDSLVMHLGMSGRFEVEHPEGVTRPGDFHYVPAPDQKHAHVVFETEDGVRVTYYDPRRFGFMALVNTATLHLHPWFAGMGPEPMEPAFSGGHLKAAFKDRKQGPKTLLLDQHIVAGLGNIYVCEALHRSRISPFKPAGKVTATRLETLAVAVREVIDEAIEAGGSSLKDFAQTDGALGYFQHRFRVYDREGRPCPNEGCGGVIARKVQAGRSTFYCPVCQR
jgi:formamidopyrimidine-DNA glycosylase